MLIFFLIAFVTIKAQAMELTTFNVGLAYNYVALAEKRRPLIINKLKELKSDAVCLQEVWHEQDVEDFIVETQKNFPYHARTSPRQKYSKKRPPCFLHNLFGEGKFGTCLLSKCMKKKGDDLTSCVINSCQSSLQKIKKDRPLCLEAIITQVEKSKGKALLSLFNPFSPIKLFSYSGQAGILLLSKHPLSNIKIQDYFEHSTSVRRAAILAKMNVKIGKEEEKITLGCTHLSANLEREVPYPGIYFNSWGEENYWQMKEFLKNAMEYSEKNAPIALMGDFNCALKGELEKSCRLPKELGFDVAGNDTGKTECSYCKNNPLVHSTENFKIDHIFFKSMKERESQVYLKELYPIEMNGLVPLSDHYAFKTKVELKK